MTAMERNNVKLAGTGSRSMLFAHGFGCDQNMWRFVEPAFRDRFRTVLIDHVGAGGSDLTAYDPDKYARLDGYAEDIVEVGRMLELSNAVFVGHSVSSMIGILASIEAPSLFSELILVSPSPRYIDDDNYVGGFAAEDIEELLAYLAQNQMGWAATMAPTIMGNADRPELSQELEASFCRSDPAIAAAFARVTFTSDNRPDLAKVRARTLVLQCKEDAIAPIRVGEYVRDAIADSELVLLDATGHCPNLSAPEQVIEAISAFV
jgi:sigma-B regulation protein RsbQ